MAFHHFQPHIDATNSPAHTPRMAKKISVAKTSSEVGTDRRAVPARASQSLAGGSEMPLVKKGNAPAGTAQRAVPTKNLPRPSDGRGSKGEGQRTQFADFVWPGRALIEMKSRGVKLSKHYQQTFDYWLKPKEL